MNLTKSLKNLAEKKFNDKIYQELYNQHELTMMHKRMRSVQSKFETKILTLA
jgi:hypothetical protein